MIRYYDRRRSPFIKRLSAAAILLLFLGLLANDRLLSANNRDLLRHVQRQQQRSDEQIGSLVDGLAGLRAQIEQGRPVTVTDIERVLANAARGPQGPPGQRGPTGPQGPPGPAGTAPTTVTTRPTPSSSTTTSTTRCNIRALNRCVIR